MKNQSFILRYFLPLTLGLGVFAFIVAKAIIVQVTTDEAYTLSILTKVSVWDLVTCTMMALATMKANTPKPSINGKK